MVNCAAGLLLALHFLTFGAQLLAVVLFWQTGNTNSFTVCLATLLFTGSFFCDAVWRGALWKPGGVQVLPIRRLPSCQKILCCCPLLLTCGCLQGVMVPLTLQQVQTGDGTTSVGAEGHGPSVTSYHGKAVNGLFEGIVCSAVLLYAYLGTEFPEGSHPITKDPPDAYYPLKFLGMRQILRVVGLISFASGGLGILHLDHCLCMKLGAYIHSGYNPRWRLFRHWLFRTCELVSRVSMHVLFLLLTQEFVPGVWRWIPLLLSLLFSVAMMYLHGGSEASRSVIWLCGFLCTFIDVFRFLDAPPKRRAARRLSKVLAMRHAAELAYIPLLTVILIAWLKPDSHPGLDLDAGSSQLVKDLGYLTYWHPVVMLFTAMAIPSYFCLLFSIGVQRFLEKEKDIFAACEQLEVGEVLRLAEGGIRMDINCQDNEGRTPLVRALLHGIEDDDRCAAICGILLENGAKLDMKAPIERVWIRRLFRREARFRWTPLHVAAYRGSPQVLKVLLRHVLGTVPEDELLQAYTDLVGNTPLHVAVNFGRAEAVRCLVARFPGWQHVRNRSGQTPLDLASSTALQEALRNPALLSGVAAPAGGGAPVAAAWAVEEHRVARISRRGLYRAPGLCSYVVGSAGGPAVGSVLKLVAEDQPLEPDPVEGDGAVDGAGAAAAAPINALPAERIMAEDLEPITKADRVPCPDWERRFQGDADPPDVGLLISGIREKGFCRQAVLGKGAYGVVWLARRRGHDQGEPYAVKNVAGMTRVARREFDMADRVRVMPHPCLAKLYGVQEFVDSEVCLLIMEFIPGGDLSEAIRATRQESRMNGVAYAPPREALPWLGQIFLALEHLHLGMRVLLRDLKPENVVLDRRRRAKLIDLGLGRIGTQSDGGFTLNQAPPGTPGYCAPEVLRQEEYNEKADLFSFGVTTWVLLTGGLVGRDPPRPPTLFNGSIDRCFGDCELLHSCIDDPKSTGALPLGTREAYAFVTSLTACDKKERPDHDGIRSHPFFTEHLRLPQRSAGPAGVERWLEEHGF